MIDSRASIVLIGPTGSGKTVVGKQLAELLGWTFVDLDELRKEWYPEFGMPADAEAEAVARGGLAELIAVWKPYELQSLERVMKDHPQDTVIALGGGQSVYVDPEHVARAKAALAHASHVVLLLPADDREASMRILQDRIRHEHSVQQTDDPEALLREFTPILVMQLQSESNVALATEMIITGHSTPEEIAKHLTVVLSTSESEDS